MDNLNFLSSGHIFFVIIVWATVFYVAIRLVKKYLPLIWGMKLSKQKFDYYFAIGESVVWGVFLLIAANWLLSKSVFFGVAFILFILALSIILVFVYFRDYMAGLSLKMENNIAKGDYISFGEIKGRVVALNVRNIEVETEAGETIYIPYHILSAGAFSIKRQDTSKIQSFAFEFECDTSGNLSVLEDEIVKFLYGLPWVRMKPQPAVSFEEGRAKVVVYPVSKDFVFDIEKAVKEKFETKQEQNDDETA